MISPPLTLRSPIKALHNVLLPLPEEPTIPRVSFSYNLKLTSFKALFHLLMKIEEFNLYQCLRLFTSRTTWSRALFLLFGSNTIFEAFTNFFPISDFGDWKISNIFPFSTIDPFSIIATFLHHFAARFISVSYTHLTLPTTPYV